MNWVPDSGNAFCLESSAVVVSPKNFFFEFPRLKVEQQACRLSVNSIHKFPTEQE